MTKRVFIDFETYSEADITRVGAWMYSRHASTEVLCVGVSRDGLEPFVVTENIRDFIMQELSGADEAVAFNSFFERSICENVLKINVPAELWRDPSAVAAMKGYPRSLMGVCSALGLTDEKKKSSEGRALISYLCQPFKGVRRYDSDRFARLCEYCRQDVVALVEVDCCLGSLPPAELKLWQLDQQINFFGVKIDTELVENAIEVLEQNSEKLRAEILALSNGAIDNPTARKQVLAFAASHGVPLENTQRGTIDDLVAILPHNEVVREVLERVLQLNRTSPAKYYTLRDITDPADGRARGLLRYHGASTGRWSGSLFQPQNLPRPTIDDVEYAVELLQQRDVQMLNIMYDDVSAVLSSCVRSTITATDALHRLLVFDFSSIEARVVAWLAGQQDVLDVFRSGQDVYIHAAKKIFPGMDITKRERTIGKVATLALGYQGGAGAFAKMASVYGLSLDDAAVTKIVFDWRTANDRIKSFWYACEEAAKQVVAQGGPKDVRGKVRFHYDAPSECMTIQLPSGRKIFYQRTRFDGNGKLSYFATIVGGAYAQKQLYGGLLVENITQAVARDALASAMSRLSRAGYRIVLSVHDEILCDQSNGDGSLEEMRDLVRAVPTWAAGLPVDCEGFESFRYKK